MAPRTAVVRILAIIYAIVVTFPSLLVVLVATKSVGQLQFFTVLGFEDKFLIRDDDKRDNSNLRHQRAQQNLSLLNQMEQNQIENDSQRWWLPSRLAQVFFRPAASTSASTDTTAASSISVVPGIDKTRLLSRSNEDGYEGRYRLRLHIDEDEGQTTDPTSTSSSWQSAYSQSFRNDVVSTTVWKFHGWWARQPLSDNDADGGEADGRGDDNHKVSRLADALNQKALLQASLAPYLSSGSDGSDVAGTVNVNVYQNRDLEFMIDADGLSPNCGVIAATTLNRDNSEKKDEICAIEIHEGATCNSSNSDEVGPPFYDPTKLIWTNGNPWHIVKYISDSNGSTSSGNIIPMYNGGNGYESQDLVGRVLLVFNNMGDPIGCGILQLISDNSAVNGMDSSSASSISGTEALPTTTSTNEEGSSSSSSTMEMQITSMASPSGSAEEDDGSSPSVDPGTGSTPSLTSNGAPAPITDFNNDSPDNAIPESELSLSSGTSPASPGGEEVNPSSPIFLDAPSPSEPSDFNTPAANPTAATLTTGNASDSDSTVPDSTASNSNPTSPSTPSDSTPVQSPPSNSQPNETSPSTVTTPTASEPSAPNSAPMAEPSPSTPTISDGSPTSPLSPSSPTSPIPIVPLPGEAPVPGQAPAPVKTPVQAPAPAKAPAPASAPAKAPAPSPAKAPEPGVAPAKAPGVAPAKEPEVALPKPPTPQSLPGIVPPPNGNVIKDEIILWDYFLPIDITFAPSPTPSISLRPTMTAAPSISPAPSMSPSVTSMPSSSPSSAPSLAPTKTVMPSLIPSMEPSLSPTRTVLPSSTPTRTLPPSPGPSQEPSLGPSLSTLPSESSLPSLSPSMSAMPSSEHTEAPSNNSTAVPSMDPTLSIMPSGIPIETALPNPTLSTTPSVSPVRMQTPTPTVSPSQTPTSRPSSAPIKKPISNPPIETLPDEPEKPIIDIPSGPTPIDEIVEITPPIDEIVEVTPPFDEIVEVTAPFDEIVEVTPP